MPQNSDLIYNVEFFLSSEKNPGDPSWYKYPCDIDYKLEKQQGFVITDEDNSSSNVIYVDPDKKYQSILGIGTSVEESTVYCLRRMTDDKRSEVLKRLFHPEEGIGMNLVRVCIGTADFTGRKFYTYDDRPDNEPDEGLVHFSIQKDIEFGIIDTLKEALRVNPCIKFFASPWTPPGWMKEKNNDFPEDNEFNLKGGRLKSEYIGILAKYYRRFIEAYREQGIDIYAMTLQNEPMLEINYPSCSLTCEQERKLAIALKKEFTLNNIDTRIWIFDHNFSDGKQFIMDTLTDEEAINAVDGLAFHDYDGEITVMKEVHDLYPDKDIMLTERSVWGARGADRIARYFRNYAISYNSWVTMLDSGISPHQWVGTPDPTMLVQNSKNNDEYWFCPEYYLIGQFSKFVQSGAKRIESSYGDPEKVTSVAFQNHDGRIIIIVINQTDKEQAFKIICNEFQLPGKLPSGTIGTLLLKRKEIV